TYALFPLLSFQHPPTTLLYTLSLHDALPISNLLAVTSRILYASCIPCSPIHAFALPLFTIIACNCCPSSILSFVTYIGAALTWFIVYTAAACAGCSQ